MKIKIDSKIKYLEGSPCSCITLACLITIVTNPRNNLRFPGQPGPVPDPSFLLRSPTQPLHLWDDAPHSSPWVHWGAAAKHENFLRCCASPLTCWWCIQTCYRMAYNTDQIQTRACSVPVQTSSKSQGFCQQPSTRRIKTARPVHDLGVSFLWPDSQNTHSANPDA